MCHLSKGQSHYYPHVNVLIHKKEKRIIVQIERVCFLNFNFNLFIKKNYKHTQK